MVGGEIFRKMIDETKLKKKNSFDGYTWIQKNVKKFCSYVNFALSPNIQCVQSRYNVQDQTMRLSLGSQRIHT